MKKSTSAQKCSEGNNGTSEQSFKGKARAYLFTSYEEKARPPPFNIEIVRYICYSPEICPSTNRHHWQGYIYLKNQMSISALQKYYQQNNGWQFSYLKIPDGTFEENRIYCGYDDYKKKDKEKKKNIEFVEFGTGPQQGARTDLGEVKKDLENGKLLDDIIIENPYLYHQYGRTLEKVNNILLQKKYRQWMTLGEWYFGKSDVGKSHTAFENYNPNTHYKLNFRDGGFWQNYKGQEIIIINEFRGEIPFSELLEIVDKWPYNVKIKGSDTVPLLAKKVIITSPKHPKEIYSQSLDKKDNFIQFKRRFKIYEKIDRETIIEKI